MVTYIAVTHRATPASPMPLLVSGSNSATAEFCISGTKAQQTYTLSSGSIIELNISVGAAPQKPELDPHPIPLPEREGDGSILTALAPTERELERWEKTIVQPIIVDTSAKVSLIY